MQYFAQSQSENTQRNKTQQTNTDSNAQRPNSNITVTKTAKSNFLAQINTLQINLLEKLKLFTEERIHVTKLHELMYDCLDIDSIIKISINTLKNKNNEMLLKMHGIESLKKFYECIMKTMITNSTYSKQS